MIDLFSKRPHRPMTFLYSLFAAFCSPLFGFFWFGAGFVEGD